MSAMFRSDKNTRILILYQLLSEGKEINKSSFCIEHGISERSFDRDIEDIRLFLSEIYSADELLFDRKENCYYMKKERPVFIDRMDAVVIAKLLLSSQAFSEKEMKGMLNVLYSVVCKRDCEAMRQYLQYDIEMYSGQNKTAILKMLGDLYAVIDDEIGIEMKYIENEKEEKIVVAPLEILFKDAGFSLIAAEKLNIDIVKEYRVDKIKSFTILSTKTTKKLKDEYFERKLKYVNHL